MSVTSKKFEDLSKDQQKALRLAGRKFVTGMFLNGVNFGGLMFFSNLILILANMTFFNSTALLIVSSIVVNITLLHMMGQVNKQKAAEFKVKVKEIVDADQ
jgi:hypothetical protein